jgi:hypothetical protein
MNDLSLIEREWRVMRFENAEGKRVEVASDRIGPEAVPVPPGYRFVDSTAMVPVDQLRGAVEALKQARQAIMTVAGADFRSRARLARAAWDDVSMALDRLGGQS